MYLFESTKFCLAADQRSNDQKGVLHFSISILLVQSKCLWLTSSSSRINFLRNCNFHPSVFRLIRFDSSILFLHEPRGLFRPYLREILLDVRSIAMVGASTTWSRPSYFVMKYLIQKGYRVIPVNPRSAGQELLGETVCSGLDTLPEQVDMVDMFRPAGKPPNWSGRRSGLKQKFSGCSSNCGMRRLLPWPKSKA